jgi:hypothetical protein
VGVQTPGATGEPQSLSAFLLTTPYTQRLGQAASHGAGWRIRARVAAEARAFCSSLSI